MCRDQKQFNMETINSTDNKVFSRELLSYIIACFQKADSMGLKEKYTCYELHLPGAVENVTEANVSEILKKEDHCKSIENSDYGCGVLDEINWSIEGGTINSQTILSIDYNPSKDVIEVVG